MKNTTETKGFPVCRIKIGRHEYDITTQDQFMDNGACIQLMTQSKEASCWGRRRVPVLSKKASSQIEKFQRHIISSHINGVVIFSLLNP